MAAWQVEHACPMPDGEGAAFIKYADTFEDAAMEALFPQGGWAILAKVRWGADAADLTGDVSILTLNTTKANALYLDATSNLLESTDGTNTASQALSPVALTEYDVAASGGSSGLFTSLDGAAGVAQSYDDGVPTSGVLSLFYDLPCPMFCSRAVIYAPQPTLEWIQEQQT